MTNVPQKGVLVGSFKDRADLDAQWKRIAEFIMEEVQSLSQHLKEKGQAFAYDVRFAHREGVYDQSLPVLCETNMVDMQIRKVSPGEKPIPAALVYIFPMCDALGLHRLDKTVVVERYSLDAQAVSDVCRKLGVFLYAATNHDERRALSAAAPVASL